MVRGLSSRFRIFVHRLYHPIFTCQKERVNEALPIGIIEFFDTGKAYIYDIVSWNETKYFDERMVFCENIRKNALFCSIQMGRKLDSLYAGIVKNTGKFTTNLRLRGS